MSSLIGVAVIQQREALSSRITAVIQQYSNAVIQQRGALSSRITAVIQ